jgi:hypothetical protein
MPDGFYQHCAAAVQADVLRGRMKAPMVDETAADALRALRHIEAGIDVSTVLIGTCTIET